MFPRPKEQKERQRVEALIKKFYEYGEQDTINMTVYPPRGTPNKPFGDPKNRLLAQAGLLTSAYLLVFYLCGYGYIFQSCLDPVRNYIRSSLKKR